MYTGQCCSKETSKRTKTICGVAAFSNPDAVDGGGLLSLAEPKDQVIG
jgi:hypothetical protein